MRKITKTRLECILIALAAIGLLDMMAYAATEGKVKIIHSVLGLLF